LEPICSVPIARPRDEAGRETVTFLVATAATPVSGSPSVSKAEAQERVAGPRRCATSASKVASWQSVAVSAKSVPAGVPEAGTTVTVIVWSPTGIRVEPETPFHSYGAVGSSRTTLPSSAHVTFATPARSPAAPRTEKSKNRRLRVSRPP
jgi:hypothetical protein